MLDPAIKGTTGILESVRMLAPTVKRVVITATFGNIMNIPKGDWPGKVYTEEDWNPVSNVAQCITVAADSPCSHRDRLRSTSKH